MKRLKVALGDLRHQTTGRNFVFMPLGISLIASYLIKHLGKDKIDVRLYDNPDVLLNDMRVWRPNVIGLSHYCWNSELSSLVFRQTKKNDPSVVCIAGGPEFSLIESESKDYLLKRPEIDFFVILEGEVSFAMLVEKIMNDESCDHLKTIPQSGIMSINPTTKQLVSKGAAQRLMNLDEIPSPYLTGLMDQWFNGQYVPSIEASRGCPFTCGFCYAGQKHFGHEKKVANFSIERIKAELNYIAEKMRNHPHILLSICDSNFGMYERDEQIAQHCRTLQQSYGWPNAFDVTTGKMNYDRILGIASLLDNKMHITCSVQSLNPKTLEVIRRKNLPIDQYKEIQAEIKKRSMLSIAELIMPMPEETKGSFLQGIKTIIDIGVEQVVPYTTMLLKGTFLASPECREKYKMLSKFRILPRQFGTYSGEKCFEIEEVCVSTNTLSFDDYLELRGFALISAFFSGELFDIIHKHLKEAGLSRHDFHLLLWKMIKSGNTLLSEIYLDFINETRNELWNSREDIYRFFGKEENYKKLLSGQLGDNLIRKYTTSFLLKRNVAAIELAYTALIEMASPLTSEAKKALEAAKAWTLIARNLEPVFKTESYKEMDRILPFEYDIQGWYSTPFQPLSLFKRPVSYRFFYDTQEIEKILQQSCSLYGDDKTFRVGKTLINWSVRHFLCKYEPI